MKSGGGGGDVSPIYTADRNRYIYKGGQKKPLGGTPDEPMRPCARS